MYVSAYLVVCTESTLLTCEGCWTPPSEQPSYASHCLLHKAENIYEWGTILQFRLRFEVDDAQGCQEPVSS